MVGYDALVLPLAGELNVTQLQRGRVLRYLSLTSRTFLDPEVGLVVDLCVIQNLVIFFPGEGHG